MQAELMKEFKFEASHILPKHPGKCSRLHGHSWVLRVFVRGEIDPETGFVMDYAELKKLVQPLVDDLDHHHLGTFAAGGVAHALKIWKPKGIPDEFYPSSENLIVWIANELTPVNLEDFPWSRLELDETCTSRCILTREAYDAGRR